MKLATDATVYINDAATLEEATKLLKAVTLYVGDLQARQSITNQMTEALTTTVLQEATHALNSMVVDQAYLYQLSYRLRTSLTPILGYAQLLLTKAYEPEVIAQLEAIIRNAERQRMIIEELEDMALRTSG